MRRNFSLSRLINLWWPYGLKRTLAHNKIWDCSNQMLEDQLLTAKQHNFELFDAVYVINSLLEVCSCWCVDGHQTLCLESLCKRHFTLFFLSISLPPSFFLFSLILVLFLMIHCISCSGSWNAADWQGPFITWQKLWGDHELWGVNSLLPITVMLL